MRKSDLILDKYDMDDAPHFLGLDNEHNRLEALLEYRILDTPPEPEFDHIVELAAWICDAPIATITLVDENRQWFKARRGLTVSETPRDIAFCAHAILQSEPLIVSNALADPRFASNPLVRGDPNLRFYAGIPLISTAGYALGTLTVMDQVSRQLPEDHLFALKVLARQVVTQLELRRNITCLNHTLAERDQAQALLRQANDQLEIRVAERTTELAQANTAYQEAERLYRMLWETTTDAVLILDTGNVIRYANPASRQVLGYLPEQLVGQNLSLIQPERFHSRHRHAFQRYLDSHIQTVDWRSMETVGIRHDGTEIPVEIAFSDMELNGQHLFVGFFRDITARKKAEAALFEEKERAQTTLKSIADGVITTDTSGKVTFLNAMAENICGWQSHEALGHDFKEVFNLIDGPGRQPVPDLLRSGIAHGQPASIGEQAVLERRDKERLSLEGSIAPLLDRNRNVAGTVAAFRDVSLSRKMAAQLIYQASHDPLTGLLNRAEFDRRLRAALDNATAGQHHSLLYLDLDQFKVVNDTCGHIAGDELLRQLSGVLQLPLGDNDTLARLGGDEFGILLENCEPARAAMIAEELRQGIVDFTFTWKDKFFTVGGSIGQVNFCDNGLTPTEVLSIADEACYMAKDKGGNRIHAYLPEDKAMALRHSEMEWVGQIKKALKEDLLCLYGQPIVDLTRPADITAHIEVLLRMCDSEGRIIPPIEFLPAAERYHLMPRIDRWVIRNTFAYVAKLINSGSLSDGYSFAINLSGASLADDGFPDFLHTQFSSSALPPSLFCFEITETVAIANLAHAAKLINDFQTIGCTFALDDFGSGMSSFAYLKHLPVDFLKIDGSFVLDIADDPIDYAMVESINHIGHLMGMRTIAEFAENSRILEKLRSIGVDFGQGFELGRPYRLQ
jgi:diguanylate cyclase (GGDEF)-like protein/PAS domain S-box-containing protein